MTEEEPAVERDRTVDRLIDCFDALCFDGELPSLALIQQTYIDYVLEYTEGNKTAAAKLLGMGRRTIYRKLKDGDTHEV